jgi:hypothetical protein
MPVAPIFALDVAKRSETPLETVPENLRGIRGEPGTATAKWKTHSGNRGFMLQHAAEVANAATHSTPAYVSAGSFVLDGQTPGATIFFRVAACDPRLPGGQTAYTPWVPVMVSA